MENLTAVIIGASHAGAQLCVSLRQEGWLGDIILISNEAYLPYHRPPLSKTFLSGDKSIDDLLIRPESFYEKQKIKFRQGHVAKINRQKKIIHFNDGSKIAYDKLSICTGASVRKLEVKGTHLKGVQYVRNAEDIKCIKQYLDHVKVKDIVIVGAGYIGLEIAASLNKLNYKVSILETAPRILQRVASSKLSQFYHQLHQKKGVDIYTSTSIQQINGEHKVESILCNDGRILSADMIIVGIGVIPNISLAVDASIDIEQGGIWIDEDCRTNDPDIVAAGDCTTFFSLHYHRKIRLESVPNANEQAKIAAATMCGNFKLYDAFPWFWSDQYDVKLQISGLNDGYDKLVIRGDIQSQSFAIFYFKDNKLIAADCINRPLEFMLSKKIINEKIQIDPTHFANESINLKQMAQ